MEYMNTLICCTIYGVNLSILTSKNVCVHNSIAPYACTFNKKKYQKVNLFLELWLLEVKRVILQIFTVRELLKLSVWQNYTITVLSVLISEANIASKWFICACVTYTTRGWCILQCAAITIDSARAKQKKNVSVNCQTITRHAWVNVGSRKEAANLILAYYLHSRSIRGGQ